MIKQEIIDRLNVRLLELKNCQTPEEVAYTIWTKHFEQCTGSKKEYRDGFINWVEAYKNDTTPQWTSYKTVDDLVRSIWEPFLDITETDTFWFGSLRNGLIEWINLYKTQIK